VQFCAVTVHSNATLRPDPAGGANSAPRTSWLGFVFVERKEGERGWEREGKEKARGRKGNEKKVKGKRRVGKENGINGMDGE